MLMTEPQHAPRKATPLQVVKAVLSAFVGIRRRSAHDEQAQAITPLQVVIAGFVIAALLVVVLVTIVSLIAR
jgi:hypothetical protein